ncbi:MAG: inositol monophosphatase family protein [archaeon]|jgi:myo-inositol-1(or 4)-monophosphatase|nr:inositol monophosphatase family protein [archaeon]
MSKSKELKVAIEAARAGGKEAMKYFGKLKHIKFKSKNLGYVTEADFASQERIKQVILKSFPNAKFLAEEDKDQGPVSGKVWVIDPIDGTQNFIKGIKLFAMSIGLLDDGVPVLGVVLNPAYDELFYAEKGKGAFLNGQPIRVSNVSKMEDGIFDVGLPKRDDTRKQNYSLFKKLQVSMGGYRAFGTASLQFCFVASGLIETFIEFGLYPWDSAGGIPILEEAGGKITDEKGQRFNVLKRGIMVASNGKLHKSIIKELAK